MSWYSIRQAMKALLLTEVEYVTLTHVTKEVI